MSWEEGKQIIHSTKMNAVGGDGEDEKRVSQLRGTGGSRGDIQGTMDINHIEEDEWKDCQDAVRETRKPFMAIRDGHEERAEGLAQAQHLGGG